MTYPVWPDVTADALERELLARWKAEGLFRRVQEATRGGEPFVFFEGPPTANGRPGIHHVFARTIKDLVCRFRAMQGREVTRIAGWDTHGLPVEIEVEKELKLSGKKDIEQFGVAEFNRRARESVFRYQAEWEQLSDRIAYWLDYDRPYVTFHKEYVETVWWLLKRLHEKELLYRGYRVLPYCPRCGTVLSSHELALGYEEVTSPAVYVTFPLAADPSRQLLIWTTTPWTLLSNAAVAVHPDLEYGEYQLDDRTIILATARAAALESGKVEIAAGSSVLTGGRAQTPRGRREGIKFSELPLVRTLRGTDLVGLRYTRPLEFVPLPEDRTSRVVVAADFVTAEDGSGLVHMAPAFGADDFAVGQREHLALVRPVAADGTFTGTEWPELNGKLVTARETADLIIARLKADGRLHLNAPHKHTYPHCWRCKSALIYYARDSFFVRTSAVKDRMLALNAQVNWNPPEVGSGRFGEWLANNVDWALSRDRYWGTPLPVWVSDSDPSHMEVIGSYAELAERAGITIGEDFDPHKPGIDAVTWPAPDGGTMRRVPEVIDTWFDSGAMPYAQWHYPFEHAEQFARHFPADYICEGLDQTRGWFYSLLAIATTVFDALPYRNVIVNGLVLDAQGQKMSKSRGNTVNPWELTEKVGADVLRFYLVTSGKVWLPKPFDPAQLGEVAGGFFNTLKQTYRFFALYAGDWRPDGPVPKSADADAALADRWLRSRLAATVGAVTAAWAGYDVTAGARAIEDFVVNDLSNWWVRLARGRFWMPDQRAEPAACATLHEALVTVARLLAPVSPFQSDWIHRALTAESVHLARFPGAGTRDEALERAMDAVRRLASLARAARETGRIPVRRPLATMRVAVPRAVTGPSFDALLPLLQAEVNVKAVELVESDASLVTLRGKANFRALGKRFGKQTPAVAALAAKLDAAALRRLEHGEPVTLDAAALAAIGAEAGSVPEVVELLPEDVTVEREVASDWLVASDGPFVAALDPARDEALVREGLARELVSLVQRMRKDAGYEVATRIALWVDGDAAVVAAAAAHGDFIRAETLAKAYEVGSRPARADLEQTVDIDGLAAVLAVAGLSNGRPTVEP